MIFPKKYKVSLKHFKYLFFILPLVFCMYSCEPDDPDDIPTEDARTKFVGSWLCVEASQMSYTVNIKKSQANESQILLENFHHFGADESVYAIVAGFSLDIPQQLACDGTWEVKGSALMSSNEKNITFNYTASDFSNIDTISANYSKQ